MSWLPLIAIVAAGIAAQAQFYTEFDVRNSRDCRRSHSQGSRDIQVECGREVQLETDNRPALFVEQPVGPAGLRGACNGEISPTQSFRAQINTLLCGEGAVAHDRLQTPVSKQVMSRWSSASRSGTPDAQQKMQEIRKMDLKFEGEIEFPVFESWTYEAREGGYNSSCGMENWDTQCQISRSEIVTWSEEVTDYDNCLEYEKLPEPSPAPSSGTGGGSSTGSGFGSGSSSGSRSSYRPDNSPVDRSTPRNEKGSGESRDELKDKRQKRWDEGSVRKLNFDRMPAGGRCLKYGKKTVRRSDRRTLTPITYRCLKQRPRWCTWPVRRSVIRRCQNQKAQYVVEYQQDPNWKPGYQDPQGRKHRDYQQILPNKFELLTGESESFTVFSNFGESSQIRPVFKMESKFNEYSHRVTPQTMSCELNKNFAFRVDIQTVGRNLVKAPNPLAVPKDADGKEIFPLKVENGRPTRIYLQDLGRLTQIRAAELSRQFQKPDSAAKANQEVIYKKATPKSDEVVGLVGDAYWQETQYRFQLYEKGRWGRTSMVTVPTTFGSNQGFFMRDQMEISLIGEEAIKDSYRAAGPFHRLFGWLWERTGAEFTPGQTYFFKIQALPRGLPFYESGCPKGQVTCEGQQGREDAYSEPIIIEWKAPENIDNRSIFKRLKDFQKKFQIL
jgi:hypothetical protein